MRTTSKILILALSIIVAIGMVMIYAKTQVKPPVTLKQNNQYIIDLHSCVSSLGSADSAYQEDSIFSLTLDRIQVFTTEKKLTAEEADKRKDALLRKYVSLFLKRSFNKFQLSSWNESDHLHMLKVSSELKNIRHSDFSAVLLTATVDSLNMMEGIIFRYRQAKAVSNYTAYNGVVMTQSIIDQANQFANDPWLSHCSNLVSALHNVKTNIAQSHYNYVVGQVQKLSQHTYYTQSYYEDTLVPQVDVAITEYEGKAATLYGSRKNVDDLWSRAKNYYNIASNYYNTINND